MRIALGLQYDGSQFFGWQAQRDRTTVQQTLERALAEFAGVPLSTVVAGRTDTGVHALGQVVHIDTALERENFSWVRGVNAFLPATVAVQWAQPVSDDFHARFAAFEREYEYLLYVHPIRSPLAARRAGWIHAELDVAQMRAAAAYLIGWHDFSAFRSSQCQAKSPVKLMRALDISVRGRTVHFRFRANAFLHHMVRNIVGCLIAVGRGTQPADWLLTLLESRDRRLAAPTFMPDGLYLARVAYPAEFGLPEPAPLDATLAAFDA